MIYAIKNWGAMDIVRTSRLGNAQRRLKIVHINKYVGI
jgi:hypothetical protein